MDRTSYKRFLKRHQTVNKIVDREIKKMSFAEKLGQLKSLLLFASQAGMKIDKKHHLLNNWTLLKSKI